jgi:hypothetical protein
MRSFDISTNGTVYLQWNHSAARTCDASPDRRDASASAATSAVSESACRPSAADSAACRFQGSSGSSGKSEAWGRRVRVGVGGAQMRAASCAADSKPRLPGPHAPCRHEHTPSTRVHAHAATHTHNTHAHTP